MKRPDFFIVGAIKSGTTSMWRYLREHPQVFMAVPKEPLYFGRDLTPRYRRMTEREYLHLFAAARPDQRIGEASPQYLASKSAAREIAEFAPRAQILIMLRNPVDVMYAQHGQTVNDLREDELDFGAALDLEPQRRQGQQLPRRVLRPEALFYRHNVHFVEQLRRYLDAFSRERVQIVLFDDLAADTAATYRSVLEFLGVDPAYAADLRPRNVSRAVRSRAIQRLIFYPPRPLPALYRRLRGNAWAHQLRDRLNRANSVPQARPPMDPALRQQLCAEFAPEVAELGRLIGRDLSHWSA